MKVFAICQTDDYLRGFHPVIITCSTAAAAKRKVAQYLYEDFTEFEAIDKFLYERALERLEKSYNDYLRREDVNLFFCRYYCVIRVELEME